MNSPLTLASLTYASFTSPTILGLQYSSNWRNFAARFTLRMLGGLRADGLRPPVGRSARPPDPVRELDPHHGPHGEGHREKRAGRDRLREDEPAEQYGDDRVDVRVRAHDGGRRVPQRVRVGAVTENRSEHHKVGDGARALRAEMPPAP